MKAQFNLKRVIRDGSSLIVGTVTGYEQWVQSPFGWKEFNSWSDFSGLAGCLGVSEEELVYFLKGEVKIPDDCLPEKYRGRT